MKKETNSIKSFKQIISEYNNKSISKKELSKNLKFKRKLSDEFYEFLLKLENRGEIFIDRTPRLDSNHELRTDIKEEDMVYCSSFPSITRKSLLYQTEVEYGNFTINHILGCSHGCNFPCYAKMLALRYGRVKSSEEWLHPKIVSNAIELLKNEIPRFKKKIDFVHLSFTTDPFMYDALNSKLYPHIKKLTLGIIKLLNVNDIKVTTLTKGIYPEELINKEIYHTENEYGITLVSLDPNFQEQYETFSSPYKDRINSLKKLHQAGLKTWVSIEPYPTPNIVKQDLEDIINEINFVDKIIFGKWNYNSKIRAYKDYKNFYSRNVQLVIDYCEKNKLEYHIKEGTPHSSSDTNDIFVENKKK